MANKTEKNQNWGRPQTEDEMECYRLWFEFLKLTDKKYWSKSVLKHFDDVSGTFDEWWLNHSYLFQKPANFKVIEVKTDADIKYINDNPSVEGYPGVLALAIPLWEPKDVLMQQVAEIISKYHESSSGRPKFDDWSDYYRFSKRPDSKMLNKILTVYKVYLLNLDKLESNEMEFWQIEEEANKIYSIIDRTGKNLTLKWKTNLTDPKLHEKERHLSQKTTAKKYIHAAKEILENVVIGKFPEYSVEKSRMLKES